MRNPFSSLILRAIFWRSENHQEQACICIVLNKWNKSMPYLVPFDRGKAILSEGSQPPISVLNHEERIPVLDGLRGIAIFLVLLVHLFPDAAMPIRIEEWLKKVAQAGWVG